MDLVKVEEADSVTELLLLDNDDPVTEGEGGMDLVGDGELLGDTEIDPLDDNVMDSV